MRAAICSAHRCSCVAVELAQKESGRQSLGPGLSLWTSEPWLYVLGSRYLTMWTDVRRAVRVGEGDEDV